MQSVYFVSELLPLALQSVKKLLYDSLRSCSNAFLSVVRLPIQPASAGPPPCLSNPRKLSCQFRIKNFFFFYFYTNMKYIAETMSSYIIVSYRTSCLAYRSHDSSIHAYCKIFHLTVFYRHYLGTLQNCRIPTNPLS